MLVCVATEWPLSSSLCVSTPCLVRGQDTRGRQKVHLLVPCLRCSAVLWPHSESAVAVSVSSYGMCQHQDTTFQYSPFGLLEPLPLVQFSLGKSWGKDEQCSTSNIGPLLAPVNNHIVNARTTRLPFLLIDPFHLINTRLRFPNPP